MKYALENGMINISYIEAQFDISKRKEYLNMHPYKIWEGSDGKWYTHLPSGDGKGGRVLRKRNMRELIKDIIVEYWKAKSENPTIEEVFNEWIGD